MTDLTRFTDGSIAGRQAALSGPLRGLHRAVLRRFLDTGAPPTARWVPPTMACGTDCGSFEVMCPHTVFHASLPSARAWLADHGGLDAEILDQETAIECGRLNFGTLLTGPA
jgi:NAD-dependent dihydropyrimidine dehydrogenase PreA subunit